MSRSRCCWQWPTRLYRLARRNRSGQASLRRREQCRSYMPGSYRASGDLAKSIAAEMLGCLDAVRIETPEKGEEAMDWVRSIVEAANLLPSIKPRFAYQT